MTKKEVDIQVFKSPDEAQDDLYRQLSKLSPEQRLKNFSNLLKRIHGQSINTSRRLGGVVEIIDFSTD